MAVFLKEIGIKNYRSMGPDGIELKELSDINVLIGQNNIGKSNILRLLDHYGSIKSGSAQNYELGVTDHYKNDQRNQVELRFAVGNAQGYAELVSSAIHPFISYNVNGANLSLNDSFVHQSNRDALAQFCRSHGGTSSSDNSQNVQMVVHRPEFEQIFALPKIVFVAEGRVRDPTRTLRDDMHRIWNHGARNAHMRPVKVALKEFIKVALLQDFELHFEQDSESFSIEYASGEIVDFESLGSGIKQIFSLGLAIASTQASIVLLDEPELNMHPTLLRKLLQLIFSNTTNQYIVATHSNVLLDALYDKKVFQVGWDVRLTWVKLCTATDDVRTILDNLGIKASEILQANGIVWVEGPSDRRYITRWLEFAGCNLKEGTDFTFQYYGGKLLAHVTVDDDLEEFVNLLDVNRHAFIVMDSDWPNEGDWTTNDLAPRKRRIIEECARKNIKVWVTKGREIENYIPDSVWAEFQGEAVELKRNENAHDVISKYTNKPLNAQEICPILQEQDYVVDQGLVSEIEQLKTELEQWNP